MKTCVVFLWLSLLGLHAQEAVPSVEETPVTEPASEIPATTETAEEPASEEPEAVIPAAYDVSRYLSMWEKNPFLLKTAPVVQTQVAWSQDYALAGMFNHKGKIRISIKNKQTNEYKHITSDAKPDAEFRLVKANFNRNRSEASAIIAKGSEEAELKYDEANASQPITINNTMRPAGAGSTAAGGAPGQPANMINGGAPRIGQAGQPLNRPGVPQASANTAPRVLNSPSAVGGGVTIPGTPNASLTNPSTPTPNSAAPGVIPPVISRRRQLIPAPVVPTQP